MSKIAVWCRHKEDSVIGIGPNIPWHISSDFKRFKRLTERQSILVGQTTYESFPNHTLPNRKIYILSFLKDYPVSDKANHFVLNDFSELDTIQEDLYICGGASIYKIAMASSMPDVVVDCVYQGDLPQDMQGQKVDISSCAERLKIDYEQIAPDFELDNVITHIYIRKNWKKDEKLLSHIIEAVFQK